MRGLKSSFSAPPLFALTGAGAFILPGIRHEKKVKKFSFAIDTLRGKCYNTGINF